MPILPMEIQIIQKDNMIFRYRITVTAKVKGTHTYTVKLREDDGELDYSCTCPKGDEGAFCKHCAAVGAFLA
jgi:uncharacterized Zn finger protein